MASEKQEKNGQSPALVIVVVVLLIVCFVCALCFGSFYFLGSLEPSNLNSPRNTQEEVVYGEENSGNEILSIPVSGVILNDAELDGAGGGFLGTGMSFGYDIQDQLRRAAKDDNIKAVVLEINSPGGTITGSQAISDGVKYFRDETKKPVFAFVSGLAASGGYWAAVSADSIYVDQGSMVGSVGVITGPYQFYDKVLAEDGGILVGGVVTQNGIESTYYTAGENKDTGSPYRRLTTEEVNQIKTSLNNEYEIFVSHVAGRRKVTNEEVKNKFKADLFDVKAAKDLKMIDKVANRYTTYEELAKKAGVDDYKVVREKSELGFFDILLGVDSKAKEVDAKSMLSTLYKGNPLVLYPGAIK